MIKPVRFRLLDILGTGERARDLLIRFDAPDADHELIKLALERLTITLGEAVNQLPDALLTREPEIAWKRISGLRNILVHDYDRVNDDQVVAILRKQLEPLIAAIERLLAEEP